MPQVAAFGAVEAARVVGSWTRRRFPFLLAAALIAAGLGDPLVEALAGAGAFGPGYADNNHLGVVPALLAAALVLFAVFVLRCYEGWCRRRGERNAAMRERPPGLGELPIVLAMQLGAVCGMEFVEAAVARVPMQPGLEWLGGPAAWSVPLYAMVALAALAIVRRYARAMPRACAAVVRALGLFLIRSARVSAAPYAPRSARERCHNTPALLARRIGGRAPPLARLPI